MRTESFEKAVSIFRSGVEAVSPYRAVKTALRISGDILSAGEDEYLLNDYANIYVLGAGKCTGEMARAVEEILAGRGFGLEENRVAIQTVSDIRNTPPKGLVGDFHPFLKSIG